MRRTAGSYRTGIPGRAEQQKNTANGDRTGNDERRGRLHPGNHHANHRADGVADIGQRVIEGKRLDPLAHRQLFTEGRLGADEEQRRRGFADD